MGKYTVVFDGTSAYVVPSDEVEHHVEFAEVVDDTFDDMGLAQLCADVMNDEATDKR